MSLVQLDDITKIYVEFKGDVSYFVNLSKAAKEAKMGIPQVANLLRVVIIICHRFNVDTKSFRSKIAFWSLI